jgi:uncharacterized protein (TIGR02147 family)
MGGPASARKSHGALRAKRRESGTFRENYLFGLGDQSVARTRHHVDLSHAALFTRAMIFEHESYRSFLRALMKSKQRRNRLYSMRSMARTVGLAPSTFSELLAGKVNLSLDKASLMASKLKLTEAETEYFLLLVQLEDSKEPQLRARLRAKLDSLNGRDHGRPLPPEQFSAFSDWYYPAILMLTFTQRGLRSARDIAQRLGLTSTEAAAALDRLIAQGWIKPADDGKYRMETPRITVASAEPDPSLQKFHGQMLQRACDSLPQQTPAERIIASETFPMSIALLPEAERLANEYLTRLLRLSRTREGHDDIYHAGIQVFRLTQKPAEIRAK